MSKKSEPKKERDAESSKSRKAFIETLRRAADALEKGESFRIQVAGERLTVPADAQVSVEHERSESQEEEIEFQFRWKREK